MRYLPLLLFILVPLAELAILIKLGEVIGIGATILLVIGTAVLGVSLLKRQGLAALARARSSVDAGEFPVESVIDGVCLLIAGAFLLTPGLLTDTVGFTLLVPAFRLKLAHWIFDRFKNSEGVQFSTFGMGPDMGSGHGADMGRGARGNSANTQGQPNSVIEGEYEDIDDEPSEPSEPEETDKTPERKLTGPDTSDSKSSPWRK